MRTRTAKQSAASRANSQHSTGPRTQAGKSASRFNALQHGIHAESQVIFEESAADLAELAAEYHHRYSPADAPQRFLVDTLVSNEWRLRRLRRAEAELWNHAHGDLLGNKEIFAAKGAAVGVTSGELFNRSGEQFDRLQRIINACERNFHRALKELKSQIAQAQVAQTQVVQTQVVQTQLVQTQVAQAQGLRPPQPEQSKPPSEPSASFRQNPPTPPQATPEPNPIHPEAA